MHVSFDFFKKSYNDIAVVAINKDKGSNGFHRSIKIQKRYLNQNFKESSLIIFAPLPAKLSRIKTPKFDLFHNVFHVIDGLTFCGSAGGGGMVMRKGIGRQSISSMGMQDVNTFAFFPADKDVYLTNVSIHRSFKNAIRNKV